MSLIEEYGKRKEQQGIMKIVVQFLESGMSAEELSWRLEKPLDEILTIKSGMQVPTCHPK